MAIEFGSFRIDLGAGLLLRDGEPILLRPKTWGVLLHLVQRPGQLISKQELREAVWGHIAVGEAVLSKSIGELRVALGDSFKKARLVETVQHRGFRFIAPVRDRSIENSGSAPNGPWQPARVAATDDRPPGIDEPPRPFIGRAEELRRLETLLASVRGGQREIVFVTGGAGIGKTALVEAFLDLPAVRQGPTPIRVARGFCVEQHGPPEPYMPVLNALGWRAAPTLPRWAPCCARSRRPGWPRCRG
jgi:DNA-binding winged helix-turn-helix (wHTH) protein